MWNESLLCVVHCVCLVEQQGSQAWLVVEPPCHPFGKVVIAWTAWAVPRWGHRYAEHPPLVVPQCLYLLLLMSEC